MENQNNNVSVLQPQQPVQKPTVMRSFPGKKNTIKAKIIMFFATFLVVIGGIVTGWFLSGGKTNLPQTEQNSQTQISDDGKTIEGVLDESRKYSEAEGKLVEGGIQGEGTHHLEREGGPSKYVYLTSTSIGIDSFVGKKVKVWGETISGKIAPWLMDVVKIQSLE